MNNEPVAWMYERPNGSAKLTFVREPMAGTVVTETPLYTHPAKTLTDDPLVNFKPVWQEKPELTLTDEEIHDLIVNKVTDADMIREALRKAQEK
jgi:hypothetical protein